MKPWEMRPSFSSNEATGKGGSIGTTVPKQGFVIFRIAVLLHSRADDYSIERALPVRKKPNG